MARPFKQGIDYFPFDVELLSDRKLRRPKNKHGYLASVVYITLLCLIYKDKGYYLDYSEAEREDVQLDILEHLQGKFQPTTETVREIIEDLVACGLFSHDLFSKNIISSHRIQCTYYKATADRKTANTDWGIWLLEEAEMRELSSRNPILINFINRQKNEVNPANNKVNQSDKPQSKAKKSKEKESKENKRIGALVAHYEDPELNQIFCDFLDSRKSMKVNNTDRAVEMLKKKIAVLPDGIKIKVIEESIMNGWKGLFPDKFKNATHKNNNTNIQVADDRKKAYEELDQLDEKWLFSELEVCNEST